MALGLALLLAGCATAGVIQPTEVGYKWTATKSMVTGNIEPVVGTFFSKACPKVGMTADHKAWIEQHCEKATLASAPPGEEAYSYVFKIKVRSLAGIPYGEQVGQIYVIGTRETCLAVSEAHNHRQDGRVNEGNLRLSADPAERCAGPVWVRQ